MIFSLLFSLPFSYFFFSLFSSFLLSASLLYILFCSLYSRFILFSILPDVSPFSSLPLYSTFFSALSILSLFSFLFSLMFLLSPLCLSTLHSLLVSLFSLYSLFYSPWYFSFLLSASLLYTIFCSLYSLFILFSILPDISAFSPPPLILLFWTSKMNSCDVEYNLKVGLLFSSFFCNLWRWKLIWSQTE